MEEMTERVQLMEVAQEMATTAAMQALTADVKLTGARRTEALVMVFAGRRLVDAVKNADSDNAALDVFMNLVNALQTDTLRAIQTFNDGASSAHLSVSQCGRLESREEIAGVINAIDMMIAAFMLNVAPDTRKVWKSLLESNDAFKRQIADMHN